MEEQNVTQEETKQEDRVGYLIGSLSIDKDGVWHMSYMGPHRVDGQQYFGNGIVSLTNVRELFDIVGSRLNRAKDIFVEKILEIEAVKELKSEDESSDTSVEQQNEDVNAATTPDVSST